MAIRSGSAAAVAIAAGGADQAWAWTTFWEEQKPQARCLEAAPPHIHRLFEDHWRSFAARLPSALPVLDVGCGSGNVALLLASLQPRLRIIGVDAARVPASLHPRISILAGTAVESLPFPNATLGAAVSQFGFEYSNVARAAEELNRVLAPGAALSLVVHHSDSPIVRGNHQESCALQALTDAGVRSLFLAADAASLRSRLMLIEARFGANATTALVARALAAAVRQPPDRRVRVWEAIVQAIAPDRILSDALEASCVGPDGIDQWLAPLRALFDVRPPVALVAEGQPLAWKIEGIKREAGAA